MITYHTILYAFLVTTHSLGVKAFIPFANEGVQIQPITRGSFPRTPCLTVFNATNNSPLLIDDCFAGIDERGFQVVQGGATSGRGAAGQIKIFNTFCLDVTNGVNADGTKVQSYTCFDGNTNQQWEYNSDGTITWAGTNKCLDLTNGDLSNGNQIQIWTCTAGNTNQQWTANAISQPLAKLSLTNITGSSGEALCIGAENSNNGSPVFITDCSDTTARKVWSAPEIGHGNSGNYQLSFGPNGPTKCLDVTNGSTTPGTKLQLWDCIEGSTNQDFIPIGNIRWEGTGLDNPLCVDLTNGVITSRNQLQIWTCVFNNNQYWSDIIPGQNDF